MARNTLIIHIWSAQEICSPYLLGAACSTFTSGDLNTLTTIGIYAVGTGAAWSNITNKPDAATLGAGIIEVKAGSASTWVTQYIYTQDRQVWFRCVNTNDSQYNTRWQILSNFGCNTPEALASLLGMPSKIEGTVLENGSLGGNYPCNYGTSIKFKASQDNYSIILCVEMVGGATTTGGIWIAMAATVDSSIQWKKLSTT